MVHRLESWLRTWDLSAVSTSICKEGRASSEPTRTLSWESSVTGATPRHPSSSRNSTSYPSPLLNNVASSCSFVVKISMVILQFDHVNMYLLFGWFTVLTEIVVHASTSCLWCPYSLVTVLLLCWGDASSVLHPAIEPQHDKTLRKYFVLILCFMQLLINPILVLTHRPDCGHWLAFMQIVKQWCWVILFK